MKVNVCGINVEYIDQGSGVPIILMHGNPDRAQSWEPVINEIGNGVRIIAPDFPGFGQSDPLPKGFNLLPQGMAQFWDDFINALNINESIVICVHDFGGSWLLPWVAANPHRVRGLLIMNTMFHQDFKWHFWARVWQIPLLGELSMLLMNRPLAHYEMSKASPGLSKSIINKTYESMNKVMQKNVLRCYRAYKNPQQVFKEWEEKLELAIKKIPTRVIWGDQDPYVQKSFADRFGVEATHLPGHGHWVYMTQPNLVANTLKELAQ